MRFSKLTSALVSSTLIVIFHAISVSAADSCYDGQSLWQWTQGREKMIEASANCSGDFKFAKQLNDFPQYSVSVLSSKTMYVDVSNPADERLGKLDTEDKLKLACAMKAHAYLREKHPGQLGRSTVLDLKVGMKLTPDERKGSVAAGNFSSRDLSLNNKQITDIQAKLNAVNSCSSFPISDENGINHISNCTASGIDFSEINSSERIKSNKGRKVALALAAGALAGVIRGGTKIALGNFTERLLFDATMAGISQMGKGHISITKEDWKDIVTNLVRGFIAMSVYETHDFVNGGQKDRGIGTKGPGTALTSAFIQNTLMCGIFNGSDCGAVGGISAAGYIAAGNASNDQYEIGGIKANKISEAVVGMAMGFSMLNKSMKDEERERGEKYFANVRVSANDVCVDVADILSPPDTAHKSVPALVSTEQGAH
jgi:hypothetical protein